MGSDGDADTRLDRAFLALADPVRRAIVARLSRGPATVNELAAPFDITKQAVSKHIQVLEQAGLGTKTPDAQRKPVHLAAGAPAQLARMGGPDSACAPSSLALSGYAPMWARSEVPAAAVR